MKQETNSSIALAIAKGVNGKRTVLFAGAGVSACAGFPVWDQLLGECITVAEGLPDSNVRWIREYSKGNDSLMVAEMLQRSLGSNRLHTVLQGVLRKHKEAKPSPVHRALAAISWGQVLTTNYDGLLEECRMYRDRVLTWQDDAELMELMRRDQPLILKIHGSIDQPKTLILSRSEFGQLQHQARSLTVCMTSMLLMKSFVFIGYSMRDPDIQHLLERYRHIAGPAFGPHYAVFPSHEVVPEYSDFLKERCGVQVVSLESRSTDGNVNWPAYQENLLRFIRQVEGEVLAAQGTQAFPIPELPRLSRKHSLSRLLQEAIRESGADRGDVCIQASESSLLERIATLPPGEDIPNDILPNQVIGTVFLNRRETDDWINLDNVENAAEYFAKRGYPRAIYREGTKGVVSELAVPIYSNGHRCGVLNLESREASRFTEGHVKYARTVAEHVGWILAEVARRNNTVNRFKPYFSSEGIKWLTGFVLKRRAVQLSELRFALYELDYTEAQLIGHSTVNEPLRHDFEGSSLAAAVLLRGRSMFYDDATKAGGNGLLDPKGLEHFDIQGPIAGFPIRFEGTTIAVLVAWCRIGNGVSFDKTLRRFRIASERVLRICKLLAADDKDNHARAFLLAMDSAASKFQGKDLEDAKAMQASGQWQRFIDTYLKLLLDKGGFTRVRLWVRNQETASAEGLLKFTVEWADSIPTARVPRKSPRRYQGVVTDTHSQFTALTVDRAAHDPYSRRQHWSVFGKADERCGELDKNPESEWAVAPLVKAGQVWGFISGEVDTWDRESKQMGCNGRLVAFNHFALDVVAHTVTSFHPHSLNWMWGDKKQGRGRGMKAAAGKSVSS